MASIVVMNGYVRNLSRSGFISSPLQERDKADNLCTPWCLSLSIAVCHQSHVLDKPFQEILVGLAPAISSKKKEGRGRY